MTDTIKLWHVSWEKDYKLLEKQGLVYDESKTCAGGQDEGVYFFTRSLFAKEWVKRHIEQHGSKAFICMTQVKKSEICFPNWKLDLCFNLPILEKLPLFLKQHFKVDKDGSNIELNLPAQYAEDDSVDDDFYFRRIKTNITGLSFKKDDCYVRFNGETKPEQVKIHQYMSEDYLGLADRLITYLGENDKKFLKYYNTMLQKQIANPFKIGAIKCVNPEKEFPVRISTYNAIIDDPFNFYATLGTLVSASTDFHNYPKETAKAIAKSFLGLERY